MSANLESQKNDIVLSSPIRGGFSPQSSIFVLRPVAEVSSQEFPVEKLKRGRCSTEGGQYDVCEQEWDRAESVYVVLRVEKLMLPPGPERKGGEKRGSRGEKTGEFGQTRVEGRKRPVAEVSSQFPVEKVCGPERKGEGRGEKNEGRGEKKHENLDRRGSRGEKRENLRGSNCLFHRICQEGSDAGGGEDDDKSPS